MRALALWMLGISVVSAATTTPSGGAHLPAYSREVLPNGIVFDIVPVREVPLVTIRILIRGGAESNPTDKAGLSGVTADAVRRGTSRRSAQQFSNELDTLGATWFVDSDMQSTVLSTELLARDLDTGLDLMLDALTRPAFPRRRSTNFWRKPQTPPEHRKTARQPRNRVLPQLLLWLRASVWSSCGRALAIPDSAV